MVFQKDEQGLQSHKKKKKKKKNSESYTEIDAMDYSNFLAVI